MSAFSGSIGTEKLGPYLHYQITNPCREGFDEETLLRAGDP